MVVQVEQEMVAAVYPLLHVVVVTPEELPRARLPLLLRRLLV
jgi:hypothetical protein